MFLMRLRSSLNVTPSSVLSLFALSISIVAFALVISGYRESASLPDPKPSSLNERNELYDCVAKMLNTAKPEILGIPLYVSIYEQASLFCGRQIEGLDELNEFNVRLEGFSRQRRDDPIVLWMVVAITISGVGLAALQLIASYMVASRGRGELGTVSEFSVERDKLTFKSSITGLVILVVSLAFFTVYVKWVYPITEVKFDVPQSDSSSARLYPPGQVGVGPQWNQSDSVRADSIQSRKPAPSAMPTRGIPRESPD
jgi:hypothetical protein